MREYLGLERRPHRLLSPPSRLRYHSLPERLPTIYIYPEAIDLFHALAMLKTQEQLRLIFGRLKAPASSEQVISDDHELFANRLASSSTRCFVRTIYLIDNDGVPAKRSALNFHLPPREAVQIGFVAHQPIHPLANLQLAHRQRVLRS